MAKEMEKLLESVADAPCVLGEMKRRLLPLLEAGEAARNYVAARRPIHSESCSFDNAPGDEGDSCSCGLREQKEVHYKLINTYDAAKAKALEGL